MVTRFYAVQDNSDTVQKAELDIGTYIPPLQYIGT